MFSSLGFGSRGRTAAKTSKGLANFFSTGSTVNPPPAAAKLELTYSRHGEPAQGKDRAPTSGGATAGSLEAKQTKGPSSQALHPPINVDEYIYQRPLAPKLDISESIDSLRCESGSIFDISANVDSYIALPVDVTDTSDATSSTSSPPSPSPLARPRTSSVSAPTPKPVLVSGSHPSGPAYARHPPTAPPPPQVGPIIPSRVAVYVPIRSDPRFPPGREVSPERGREATRIVRTSPQSTSLFAFPTGGEIDEVQVARPGTSAGPRPRRMSRDQPMTQPIPIPGPQRRGSGDRPALRLETDRVSPSRDTTYAEVQYQSPAAGPPTARPRLDSIDYAAKHYRHEPPGLGPSVSISFPKGPETSMSAPAASGSGPLTVSRRTDQEVLPSRPRKESEARDARSAASTSPPQGSGPSRQSSTNSVQTVRSVRWDENLICPSPILPSQRRQGWFNRRGDQLWTNDGKFKSPPVEEQYPADLDGYPEAGQGWMNEQGVRIDMQHRLVPKVPARSALKRATI
ncbi:hypothetical protein NEOLEDRAFT_1183837 [Neolentinus lepideus HHB14362 ss-1]|uniref:Uncharacterized protein n=1 Tax=Neolentinus lepideus HHB14362 ss-1 TaxID=1314782 RepID=A0A165MY82_9AGAM|nr:hypothetical protein NEOLEDRAFT_1183837 [Neolentinus lepideus HHB14362 ss-1]